jgi:hypothetical protein
MTDITLKYNLLDNSSRREVLDFMDFLLNKKPKVIKNTTSEYKKKILKVSVWSDKDIELMTNNQQKFNEWKVQEW